MSFRSNLASGALAVAVLLGHQSAALAQATAVPNPSLGRVLKDTVIDFKHLPSTKSITWLTVGAVATILGHAGDAGVTKSLAQPRLEESFEPGSVIGGLPLQLGGAFATFAVGHLTNSPRVSTAGAELIRAQILAQTLSWAVKSGVKRTRPDGTSYSFPSGHTASAFATATVLQQNFGWKAGIPAFGVASYVAASRIQSKRHYLSDVAFGAAIGVLAGKTITIGHGSARMAVAPMAAPGGGGVAFTLLGRR